MGIQVQKEEDKLSYSISQLQTSWNLRLLLVQDDPKLSDDSEKVSIPNGVVGGSISGCEIDKSTSQGCVCLYVNSSIMKMKMQRSISTIFIFLFLDNLIPEML